MAYIGMVATMHEEYLPILTSMLGEKRLHHSLCVRDRAAELAKIHSADESKATLAGLLHDIYHDRPKVEQLQTLERHGILLDTQVRAHPVLWHAPCAAVYLEEELGIRDEEVLSAVRYHTTGRQGMTLLEKIVFLADATSSERDYPGVEENRSLANRDLNASMLAFLQFELARLVEHGQPIVRDAWEAYNDFSLMATQRT
jgi:predicted HD superfamily hydrolase involved in NAD metabolism